MPLVCFYIGKFTRGFSFISRPSEAGRYRVAIKKPRVNNLILKPSSSTYNILRSSYGVRKFSTSRYLANEIPSIKNNYTDSSVVPALRPRALIFKIATKFHPAGPASGGGGAGFWPFGSKVKKGNKIERE